MVFSEIMYNPAGENQTLDLEFVELHNQMSVDMDVSRWSVAGGIELQFPDPTIVPGGGYLVLARDPQALSQASGYQQALGPYDGHLANEGELIELRDQNGRLMDQVEYSEGGIWPVAPDGSGTSLAKPTANLDSSRADNWVSSIVRGGTPGRGNFPATEQPVAQLAINELASGITDPFWIELINYGNTPLDVTGYRVETSAGDSAVVAGGTIAAGVVRVLDARELGFGADTGQRVYVVSPDGALVIDAARVEEAPQARWPDGTGSFWHVEQGTPGQANVVPAHDEVVINEIFYHGPETASSQGVPATIQDTALLPWSAVWRFSRHFNFGAGDLPLDLDSQWSTVSHVPDAVDWFAGPGPLGYSERRPPESISTALARPQQVTNFITTYYFETELSVTQQQIDGFDQIVLQHMVDDGAVFYLNGQEIQRFNMPAGIPTSKTLAVSEINTAAIQETVLDIRGQLLAAPATNRLSVEVHQGSVGSADIVWGAQLLGRTVTDPGRPAQPAQEDPQEWIELLNRSDHSVDLGGWRLEDAVQWEMPAGTLLAPGQYLVVARDPAALAQAYPAIASRIVGPFSGQLANTSDRILLRDGKGNPADVVEYYDGGGWPMQADGGGASLELRDPRADNASSSAWAATVQDGDTAWKTYVYEGKAERSSIGPDSQWNELLLGLLDAGEVLLDDIHVVQDPSGRALELIQNGSFQQDTVGQQPATWRIIGNHRHSQVVTDPDDPDNKALRLVATGPTEHMHNHAETTVKNGGEFVRIQNNAVYRISYRAKWVSGSNQLNSRLYFNRLPRTTLLERSGMYGTPGTRNSVYEENLGPTYVGLTHTPAVPQPGEDITVIVQAQDPDGVDTMTLWSSVASGPWSSIPWSRTAGAFTAAGWWDRRRARSCSSMSRAGIGWAPNAISAGRAEFACPGAGRRRASAATNGLHNVRIILTPDDADFLHDEVELMSDDELPATVIYDESEIFYNANVRLSGSERARPFAVRLGFKLTFPSDQLFRGVHSSVIVDRSESTGFGQRELIYYHGMNHAGGLPAEYNDLIQVITPRRAHTGSAMLEITRASDEALDSQFENGSQGQVFEYELTYYPQTTVGGTPEGRKRPQPDGTNGVAIQDIGDDKEDYRWAYLIKDGRAADDYDRLIEFAKAMGQRGDAFEQTIGQFIDVDQWLRAFAFSVITGHGDNYGVDGAQHNLRLYIRPSDQKVLFLPHDFDAFFDATRALVTNTDLRKLIDVPANEHMYYGHVYDMLQTTFNQQYMQHWTDNFGRLLPRQRFDNHLNELVRRSEFLDGQIRRLAPQVEFAVTSGDVTVDGSQTTIAGNGWINVRELRLAGSSVPLAVEWTDATATAWQATIPVALGSNQVTVEAYDFQGKLIGTDSITVTGTVDNPVRDALRISELNFNPHGPTAAELGSLPDLDNEDFEFVEVTNTGNTDVNLWGAALTDGISFVFPDWQLAAGQSAVIVGNPQAFRLRYGDGPQLIGAYEGRLNNAGETLRLQDAHGQAIQEFAFSDQWYADADGGGYSLHAVPPPAQLNVPGSWRPSIHAGGSPGAREPFLLQPGDANRDQVFNQLDLVWVAQAAKYGTGASRVGRRRLEWRRALRPAGHRGGTADRPFLGLWGRSRQPVDDGQQPDQRQDGLDLFEHRVACQLVPTDGLDLSSGAVGRLRCGVGHGLQPPGLSTCGGGFWHLVLVTDRLLFEGHGRERPGLAITSRLRGIVGLAG